MMSEERYREGLRMLTAKKDELERESKRYYEALMKIHDIALKGHPNLRGVVHEMAFMATENLVDIEKL